MQIHQRTKKMINNPLPFASSPLLQSVVVEEKRINKRTQDQSDTLLKFKYTKNQLVSFSKKKKKKLNAQLAVDLEGGGNLRIPQKWKNEQKKGSATHNLLLWKQLDLSQQQKIVDELTNIEHVKQAKKQKKCI